MNVELTGWSLIVLVLCIATFGLYWCFTVIFILWFSSAGLITMLYLCFNEAEYAVSKDDLLDNPLEQTSFATSLTKVMYIFNDKEEKKNSDQRITGSEIVDTHLHDIFGLLMNSYITPWYTVITRDTEFVDAIRETVLSLSQNISNRVKNVNWLYYLAGRLVEDLAGHLRLFRGAGGGEKSTARMGAGPTRSGSPARSPARNSAQQHRRNKSDTDVAIFGGVRDGQRNAGNSRCYLDKNKSLNMTFEHKFFELEREFEKNLISREKICTDEDIESCFITEIVQILAYISLGSRKLKSRASFAVIRAVSCSALQSILRYATDPDALNTLVLRWSCRDGLSSESFLSVLRTTDNVNELKATLDLVQKEIQNLVSKDTGGECDITVKQQLSSLQYLIKIMNGRCLALAPAISTAPKIKPLVKTQLPLGFLLDNHLALCYFLDYAQSVGAHTYIFCLLSIQAWRVSTAKCIAAQKASSGLKGEIENILAPVKIGAKGIHDQYLAVGSLSRLDIPPAVSRTFLSHLNSPIDNRTTNWFDDVEDCVLTKLKVVETDFHSSAQYSRLLAELDMIEGMNASEKFSEEKRSGSTGMISFGSKTSLNSLSDGRLSGDNSDNTAPNSRSQSPGLKTSHDVGIECVEDASAVNSNQESQENMALWVPIQEQCHLETVIVETGLVQERGRTFGVYAVEVRRRCEKSGRQQHWHIYRRYSDFHDLYVAVKEAYPELGKMEFPSKKTFHNTSRNLLERRMAALGSWLGVLATLGCPDGPPRYSLLHSNLLLPFLNPKGPHDRPQPQKAINTILVQPLRQGMRSLRSVPGQLVHTVDDFMEGVSKVLNGGKSEPIGVLQSQLPTAAIIGDIEPSNYDAEELPLRVLLILLDEVFELRSRNRWLRRQIAALLRQVITAMFADVLNKRILSYIASITSPETVVYCLDHIIRQYLTKENENVPRKSEPRDLLAKSRARVAVKTVFLSARQEELKHVMGSETTHRGLITLFELFQNQILNKRLMSVLLQGLLATLYPEQDMNTTFQKLVKIKPSRSPYVFKK